MKKSDPLRVLYLANDSHSFCNHWFHIAKAMFDAGFVTAVAAPDGPSRRIIEDAGLQFIPVRFFRGSLNPCKELLTLLDVWKAYRGFKPDLAHQTTFKPIVYGSWAARREHVSAILNNITGLGYVFTGEDIARRILRKIAERGYAYALRGENSLTVFQNPDDRELFLSSKLVRPDRCVVISGTGTDTEVFRPAAAPEGSVSILLPTRMLWDKGVKEAIDAGFLLHGEGLKFRIVLAGAPDPQNPASIAEETLREWDQEPFVEWLGFRRDMPSLISRSHIVCLPSYREGVPTALIEGASCGKPLVSADVPGCREIVRDGVNGFLVPPGDSFRLAEALRKLILQPQLRESMGGQGRRMVIERFSSEKVLAQTIEAYRRVLGKRLGELPSG